MKDVVVIGAGKIGATVAGLLASTGDYQVTLADRSPEVLGPAERLHPSGGYSAKGLPGEPLRTGFRQAGNERSA
jgi:2-polyprenyl-6-methoxyphenol hydroxylase-like FAD-dependent oxidoreductase